MSEEENGVTPTAQAGAVDRIVNTILDHPLQALTVALGLGNGQAVVNAAAGGLDVAAAAVEWSGERWVAVITWLYERKWWVLSVLGGLIFLWFGLLVGAAGAESRVLAGITLIEGFVLDGVFFATIGTLIYWGLATVDVGSAPLNWLRGFLRQLGLVTTMPDGRAVIDTEGVKEFFKAIFVYGLLIKVNVAILIAIAPSFFMLAIILVAFGAIASYITIAYYKRQPVEAGFKILGAWNVTSVVMAAKLAFVYIFLRPIFDAFVNAKGDLVAKTAMIIDHGLFRSIVECWWNGVWTIGKAGVNWDGVGGHSATWMIDGQSVPAAFAIDGVDAFQLGLIAVLLCIVILVSPLTTVAAAITAYKVIYTTPAGQTRIAVVNDDAAVERVRVGHGNNGPVRILRAAFVIALLFGTLIGGFLLVRWISHEVNTPMVARTIPTFTITVGKGAAAPAPAVTSGTRTAANKSTSVGAGRQPPKGGTPVSDGIDAAW
jgi:hypothetical protein